MGEKQTAAENDTEVDFDAELENLKSVKAHSTTVYAGQRAGNEADDAKARSQVTADARGETGVGVGLLLARNKQKQNQMQSQANANAKGSPESSAKKDGDEEYVASKTFAKSHYQIIKKIIKLLSRAHFLV